MLLAGATLGHDILMVVLGIIIGALIGFFGARIFTKKYMEKNPPINEKMIEVMMTSMGRKPNQKQIKQVMAQMNRVK